MTIVIGTCDKYEACWMPMIHGIQKYWADTLWNIVFITNEIELASYRTICVGKDESWGTTVRKGLEQVETPYILWLMDDFWITGPVNTKEIKRFLNLMITQDLHHIRLLPPSNADGQIIPSRECKQAYDNNLWFFYDNAEYRASASLGIWKKSVFQSYIKDGMTPWNFEQEAGIASRTEPNRYLCNINPTIFPTGWYCNPYPNGKNSFMSRGKWDFPAYAYAKYEKLDIDFSIHPNGEKNETYNIKK